MTSSFFVSLLFFTFVSSSLFHSHSSIVLLFARFCSKCFIQQHSTYNRNHNFIVRHIQHTVQYPQKRALTKFYGSFVIYSLRQQIGHTWTLVLSIFYHIQYYGVLSIFYHIQHGRHTTAAGSRVFDFYNITFR